MSQFNISAPPLPHHVPDYQLPAQQAAGATRATSPNCERVNERCRQLYEDATKRRERQEQRTQNHDSKEVQPRRLVRDPEDIERHTARMWQMGEMLQRRKDKKVQAIKREEEPVQPQIDPVSERIAARNPNRTVRLYCTSPQKDTSSTGSAPVRSPPKQRVDFDAFLKRQEGFVEKKEKKLDSLQRELAADREYEAERLLAESKKRLVQSPVRDNTTQGSSAPRYSDWQTNSDCQSPRFNRPPSLRPNPNVSPTMAYQTSPHKRRAAAGQPHQQQRATSPPIPASTSTLRSGAGPGGYSRTSVGRTKSGGGGPIRPISPNSSEGHSDRRRTISPPFRTCTSPHNERREDTTRNLNNSKGGRVAKSSAKKRTGTPVFTLAQAVTVRAEADSPVPSAASSNSSQVTGTYITRISPPSTPPLSPPPLSPPLSTSITPLLPNPMSSTSVHSLHQKPSVVEPQVQRYSPSLYAALYDEEESHTEQQQAAYAFSTERHSHPHPHHIHMDLDTSTDGSHEGGWDGRGGGGSVSMTSVSNGPTPVPPLQLNQLTPREDSPPWVPAVAYQALWDERNQMAQRVQHLEDELKAVWESVGTLMQQRETTETPVIPSISRASPQQKEEDGRSSSSGGGGSGGGRGGSGGSSGSGGDGFGKFDGNHHDGLDFGKEEDGDIGRDIESPVATEKKEESGFGKFDVGVQPTERCTPIPSPNSPPAMVPCDHHLQPIIMRHSTPAKSYGTLRVTIDERSSQGWQQLYDQDVEPMVTLQLGTVKQNVSLRAGALSARIHSFSVELLPANGHYMTNHLLHVAVYDQRSDSRCITTADLSLSLLELGNDAEQIIPVDEGVQIILTLLALDFGISVPPVPLTPPNLTTNWTSTPERKTEPEEQLFTPPPILAPATPSSNNTNNNNDDDNNHSHNSHINEVHYIIPKEETNNSPNFNTNRSPFVGNTKENEETPSPSPNAEDNEEQPKTDGS